MSTPTASAGGGRIPEDLLGALSEVPFDPRPGWRHPGRYWTVTKGALDFVAHNLPPWNSLLVRINPYPRPWTRVRVHVDDEGTSLAGWFAEGRPGAPAVLYAPGTFQTKDDTARKARAIRMWRDLGYHVLVVDLRGFGESHETPGSGGYVEALDLHEAARWLKDKTGEHRVVLMGDSLGGASAFIASALPGARDLFSCTLAWSPFADLVTQTEYSTTNPGVRHPYYIPYQMYRMMVYTRSGRQARDFSEFLELRAASTGLTVDELLRRSSPVTYAGEVCVPTFVHHAEDDPIVPLDQARLLARAVEGSRSVRVRVLPRGAHASFDLADPSWFWSTLRLIVRRFHAPAALRWSVTAKRRIDQEGEA